MVNLLTSSYLFLLLFEARIKALYALTSFPDFEYSLKFLLSPRFPIFKSTSMPDSKIISFTFFADNFGKYYIISEATPATTGEDIDVPS